LFIYGGISHTDGMIQDNKYFQNLILNKASDNSISGSSNLIEGSRRENITLSKGTKFCIDDALYSFKSRINLINFKDISLNAYHVGFRARSSYWKNCMLSPPGCIIQQ